MCFCKKAVPVPHLHSKYLRRIRSIECRKRSLTIIEYWHHYLLDGCSYSSSSSTTSCDAFNVNLYKRLFSISSQVHVAVYLNIFLPIIPFTFLLYCTLNVSLFTEVYGQSMFPLMDTLYIRYGSTNFILCKKFKAWNATHTPLSKKLKATLSNKASWKTVESNSHWLWLN